MASSPNLTDRHDVTLWSADMLLSDLLERADAWQLLDEAVRLDLFLEWEELVDRIEAAADAGRAGRLTAPQLERLTGLAGRLLDARAVIERLGLDYPDLGRLSLAS